MATLDPWDMSDEALEEAFRNAKADGASPITDIEDNYEEEEEVKLEHPIEDSDDNGTEIVELDGSTDKAAIAKFVESMPIADSKYIRNFMNENEPRLDMNKTIIAPSGEKLTVNVGFGVEFFRPFF